MPKMRGFKAEIWTDEKFVELTPLARLLFMGMWNYACDNGHLDDKPKQIKMRILPTDDVDATGLIDEMVDLGMLEQRDGLLVVTKLREHQRIDERYFAWCDRCKLEEIPERSRDRYLSSTAGTRGDTRAHTGSRGDTRAPTMKEGRKEGEGEGSDGESTAAGKPRTKQATTIASDWQPSDAHRRLAAERGIDILEEGSKFRDWCTATGKTYKDWEAAFRNWIRNARPNGNVRPLRPELDDQGRTILPPLPSRDPWGGGA